MFEKIVQLFPNMFDNYPFYPSSVTRQKATHVAVRYQLGYVLVSLPPVKTRGL